MPYRVLYTATPRFPYFIRRMRPFRSEKIGGWTARDGPPNTKTLAEGEGSHYFFLFFARWARESRRAAKWHPLSETQRKLSIWKELGRRWYAPIGL